MKVVLKKNQAVWAHGGIYQIFILRVFLSFKAVASVDYISFWALSVRPGVGVSVNFINILPGGRAGRGGQKKF